MDVVIGWIAITESAGVILISHNPVGTRRGRWRTCFVKHCEPFPADREDSRKEGWKYVCKLFEGWYRSHPRLDTCACLFTGELPQIIKRQLMSLELKVVAFSEAPSVWLSHH